MLIIKNVNEYQSHVSSVESMPLPQNVFMVKPTYFDVEYGINPHMFNEKGQLNTVDTIKAKGQWNFLKCLYQNLGFNVVVQEGVPQLPDMVFCANQIFPIISKDNKKYFILSNMHSDIRHQEVSHVGNFFKKKAYQTLQIAPRNDQHFFEAMGDALWLPGKRFILGGYGIRSKEAIYTKISTQFQVPIALFKLNNPKFYHLDTCLSILNSNTALYCKEAFDADGLKLLSSIFSNLIEVPLEEADSPNFACNAHSPDQKHVILNAGSTKTNEKLVQNGFIPIQVDTSEFIKAGGSVFCMKLMFF